ncbi:hypothetical protein LINGRAHAP2_LOCUS3158 [Linum grandiflorum]
MATTVNFSSVPYNKPTFKLGNSSRRPCIVMKQQGSNIITNCVLRRQAESSNGIRRQQRSLSVPRKTTTKCLLVDGIDDTSAGSDGIISPVIVVTSLYEYINAKKLKEVGDLFSEDCSLEDCSFPFPIQGTKEVNVFFQQLTSSMGKNVKFIIDRVCENRHELTVAVNWHLEWKHILIPFTRGCSFYECAWEQEGGLVIKKAVVVIESPIKPGGIVMALLKNVTAIFDEFPKAAEWFLQSPHTIVRFLMKTYATFMAPVIKPLVASYFKMWTLIARFSTLTIQLLLYISKKYFPKD